MAKQVAIIDDTPEDAFQLGAAAKRIGGFEPTLFDSTSSFRQEHRSSIPEGLNRFSAIICDNNFQASDDLHGHSFLLNTVGPALLRIPAEHRPLVLCFAPSSWEVIRKYQQPLREFGIISLHKQYQIALIGLTLRVSAEGILRPTPEFVDQLISVTTSEANTNIYFANDVAPQIHTDFMDATSFAAARKMLRDIPVCSLHEIRSAALENFGQGAVEVLNSGFPQEGARSTKEY